MQFQKAKNFILSKLKRELPQHLSYHSVEHVNDVYSAAQILAKHENISGEDLKLLLTAVLFHDSGFLIGPKNHEERSCEIARLHLPQFGYAENQLEKICGMIMATKLPQSPHNLLEEIICDADLDYLGRDDFFEIAGKLYAEFELYGIISNPIDWDKLQIKFLESHRYFTRPAIQLRQNKKDHHLKKIKERLDKARFNNESC